MSKFLDWTWRLMNFFDVKITFFNFWFTFLNEIISLLVYGLLFVLRIKEFPQKSSPNNRGVFLKDSFLFLPKKKKKFN